MNSIIPTRIAFGLVVSLAAAAAAPPARAEASPFVGRWHWNKAQSTLPAGEAAPADMTADFARVDSTHVKWSITATDAQGQPSVETFDTPANGEFYPISPGTVASFRLNGATLQGTFKGHGGETDILTCAVSKDRAKMTCNGVLSAPDGKSDTYVDVYDRG